MREITSTLLKYLDATQHVWNAYFLNHFKDLRDCEPIESYEEIDRNLFLALVCKRLNIKVPGDHFLFSSPITQILVKPKSYFDEISVLVAKEPRDANTYWEKPIPLKCDRLLFSFVCFFQWDTYAFQCRTHVKCVVKTADDERFVGKDALIDLHAAEFFIGCE